MRLPPFDQLTGVEINVSKHFCWFDPFHDFIRHLFKARNMHENSRDWEGLLQPMKRYFFRARGSLLPLNHPALRSDEMDSEFQHFQERCFAIFPDNEPFIHALTQQYLTCIQSPEAPLMELAATAAINLPGPIKVLSHLSDEKYQNAVEGITLPDGKVLEIYHPADQTRERLKLREGYTLLIPGRLVRLRGRFGVPPAILRAALGTFHFHTLQYGGQPDGSVGSVLAQNLATIGNIRLRQKPLYQSNESQGIVRGTPPAVITEMPATPKFSQNEQQHIHQHHQNNHIFHVL